MERKESEIQENGEQEKGSTKTTLIKSGDCPAIVGGGSSVPYTLFSRVQRRIITFTVGAAFFFSPLSANIYFPCLPSLQHDLHTSLQHINLTITAYIILQAVSPAFFGDLADSIGRRNVYILTFIIYDAASLGLALQGSYAGLLVLRMLQSAGCSATAAIGYGVIADVAMPSERGRMLGTAMLVANMGPSFGPLLGGILADKAGWRWAFWLLTILGGTFLVFVLLVFPETARNIVGNGSVVPRAWERPLLSLSLQGSSYKMDRRGPAGGGQTAPVTPRRKPGIPNPLESLRIIFYRDTAPVLLLSALFYAAYYCIQASVPNLFIEIYHLNELAIGVSYLAIGIGVALGGYSNGRMLDWNYKKVAQKYGFAIDSTTGDDITTFPIEEARTRIAWILVGICTLLVIGYGWALEERAHLSIPLVLQFFIGFTATCIVQTFNTLLVDIFPAKPSTAAASGNITRCALSAGSVAAMQPLLDRVGRGWFFTLVGGVAGLSAAFAIWVIQHKGMQWRKIRHGGD